MVNRDHESGYLVLASYAVSSPVSRPASVKAAETALGDKQNDEFLMKYPHICLRREYSTSLKNCPIIDVSCLNKMTYNIKYRPNLVLIFAFSPREKVVECHVYEREDMI